MLIIPNFGVKCFLQVVAVAIGAAMEGCKSSSEEQATNDWTKATKDLKAVTDDKKHKMDDCDKQYVKSTKDSIDKSMLKMYTALNKEDSAGYKTAKAACDPFSVELYPRFKSACDRYFYLPHRAEARGIGGLFFDDFNELGFDASFGFTRSVGDSFLEAYLPIFRRRCDRVFGQRERDFQLYRRGRYVEFNLVQDRGTLFGLQSGGRTESILMSLPPTANWVYNWQPEPGSAEAELYEQYLPPREWL